MKKDTFVPGEPCWIDCGTDLEKAPAFYASLFGWRNDSLGPDAGNYTMSSVGDALVGAFGTQQNPGPPFWAVYFSVDDAAKTAALVTEHGGSVLLEPMQVMDVGHMAVFTDPLGAVFSVWQPLTHKGFGVTNEPGTFCWAELMTDDTTKAATFYESVLGWTSKRSTDATMDYTEFGPGGDTSFAGMMPRHDDMPKDLPSNWGIYFAVTDTDATLAKVAELGGTTIVEPFDAPPGRMAVCADPLGAVFSVIALAM